MIEKDYDYRRILKFHGENRYDTPVKIECFIYSLVLYSEINMTQGCQEITIWMDANYSNDRETTQSVLIPRYFQVVGTGQKLNMGRGKVSWYHINTFHHEPFVWHLMEVRYNDRP